MLLFALTLLLVSLLFFSRTIFGFPLSQDLLTGRILLWHSLTGDEVDALHDIVDTFHDLNPRIGVQLTYIEQSELRERFPTASDSGLGPDLFIGPSDWILPLAQSQLIRKIANGQEQITGDEQSDDRRRYIEWEDNSILTQEVLDRYSHTTLDSVFYEDGIYALPLWLNLQGLYRNRRLTRGAVPTLDALLQEAERGRLVLISTGFRDAFWGVQTFGGTLLDAEGQVVLDRGGFANWLNWLKNANDARGMILDTNRRLLQERFQEGEAAYYVGYASEFREIQEAVGGNVIDVTLLPAGPTGIAGPFMTTDGLFFNTASTPKQQEIALKLALFVTNAEQSANLMRWTGRVPANTQTRINQRLHPTIASFAAQARTAIAIRNSTEYQSILALGEQAYRQVLEDGVAPGEAAVKVTRKMNQAINREDSIYLADTPLEQCVGVGTVTLWDLADETHGAILDEIIRQFHIRCPTIIVKRRTVTADEVRDRFRVARGYGGPVDLLLAPHTFIPLLVEQGTIRDVTNLVDADMLQQYLPKALDALRHGDRLYGIPESIDTFVLYFNKEFVNDPVRTLDELLNTSTATTGAALHTGFEHIVWTMPGFTGALDEIDLEHPRLARNLVDWLQWLRNIQGKSEFVLAQNDRMLREQFSQGKTAYYIGGMDGLKQLQDSLGENLGVTTLPAGPEGEGSPLLDVYGIMFNGQIRNEQALVALEFVLYATGEVGQQYLLSNRELVPANVTVETDSMVSAFITQAQGATISSQTIVFDDLRRIGMEALRLVLEENIEPLQAVISATKTISTTSIVVENLDNQ